MIYDCDRSASAKKKNYDHVEVGSELSTETQQICNPKELIESKNFLFRETANTTFRYQ